MKYISVVDGKSFAFQFDKKSNILPFIKSSMNSNVNVEIAPYENLWRIVLVTSKDIESNEPLTIDYRYTQNNYENINSVFRESTVDLF